MTAPVVVVGASLAGSKAIRELRGCGYDGPISLIGEEPNAPYDRPPLSKGFLAGTVSADGLVLASSDDLAELGVDFISGVRATDIDSTRRIVYCDDQRTEPFSTLLIATGASARRPPWLRDLDGLHMLRTLADSQALRTTVTTVDAVTVVGGGYIGTEVAATLAELGKTVTLIVDTEFVLDGLGPQIASAFTDLFRNRKVSVRTRSSVIDVLGRDKVEGVRLADGSTVAAEAVLVAIGAIPNSAWTRRITGPGNTPIRTDATGRVTESIWAAGDVTGGGHWFSAVRQGRRTARAILDISDRTTERLDTEIPYVWTDQFEVKVQVLGSTTRNDTLHVVRGHTIDSMQFSGLYSRGGMVTGAVVAGRPQDLARARKLVSTPCTVETALDLLTAATAS